MQQTKDSDNSLISADLHLPEPLGLPVRLTMPFRITFVQFPVGRRLQEEADVSPWRRFTTPGKSVLRESHTQPARNNGSYDTPKRLSRYFSFLFRRIPHLVSSIRDELHSYKPHSGNVTTSGLGWPPGPRVQGVRSKEAGGLQSFLNCPQGDQKR
jgi:hypothetical protein